MVAFAGILVYAIGFPLCSFLLVRHYKRADPRKRAAIGRRISLLLISYVESCWWFESVDLLRKLLLTGVVLNVSPGTPTQIWFGLVVSSAAAFAVIHYEPYRDRICGRMQKAATLQVPPTSGFFARRALFCA